MAKETCKCLITGSMKPYPCSKNCPLFGDCVTEFNRANEKPMTNADHIRAMSDEELAIMFAILRTDLTLLDRPVRPYKGRDVNDNYEWLKQPYKEKEGEA